MRSLSCGTLQTDGDSRVRCTSIRGAKKPTSVEIWCEDSRVAVVWLVNERHSCRQGQECSLCIRGCSPPLSSSAFVSKTSSPMATKKWKCHNFDYNTGKRRPDRRGCREPCRYVQLLRGPPRGPRRYNDLVVSIQRGSSRRTRMGERACIYTTRKALRPSTTRTRQVLATARSLCRTSFDIHSSRPTHCTCFC